MKFKEYLELYKANEKPASTFYHRHVSKNGAKLACFIALKLGLTPNLISALSLLLLFIACVLIVVGEGSVSALVGALFLLQISYVLDCSDGVIARINGLSSQFGAYLDVLLDRVGGLFYLVSIAVCAIAGGGVIFREVFIFSLVAFYLYQISAMLRPHYYPELKGYMKNNDVKENIVRRVVKLVYEFIDTGIFYFITSLSLIFGVLELTVFLYGVAATVLFFASLIFLYKKG